MSFNSELNDYINMLYCSAKELSEASGLSPVIISRYINNKRTPRIGSEQFEKLVNGLYEIAVSKGIKLSKEDISANFSSSVTDNSLDYSTFISNFNILLSTLKIKSADIASALNYDTSFISRIKNGNRKPANLNEFSNSVAEYIATTYTSLEQREISATLLQCQPENLLDERTYQFKINSWLMFNEQKKVNGIESFLNTINNVNLNDYSELNIDRVKISSSPIALKSNKVFYGSESFGQAQIEFLKNTLTSKTRDSIFIYNDISSQTSTEDTDIQKKWRQGLSLLLKKGSHINVVHTLNRPISEIVSGLEYWLPLYMTGSISPYYFESEQSELFSYMHITSSEAALSAECEKNNLSTGKSYITTKKEEIEYYRKKSRYMLSKAKPLMDIYLENEKEKFNEFLNKYSEKDIKQVESNCFDSIDFYLNTNNEWIIVNKKTEPEIHFVIYNRKLIDSIKSFILN